METGRAASGSSCSSDARGLNNSELVKEREKEGETWTSGALLHRRNPHYGGSAPGQRIWQKLLFQRPGEDVGSESKQNEKQVLLKRKERKRAPVCDDAFPFVVLESFSNAKYADYRELSDSCTTTARNKREAAKTADISANVDGKPNSRTRERNGNECEIDGDAMYDSFRI